jgi:hypothetical protein
MRIRLELTSQCPEWSIGFKRFLVKCVHCKTRLRVIFKPCLFRFEFFGFFHPVYSTVI